MQNFSTSSPQLSAGSYRGVLISIMVLGVLGFLLVLGCLNAPFSSYDDHTFVTNNPRIASSAGWLEPFEKPYQSIYMPLTLVSFRLNLAVFGAHAPWSFRVVNVLFHVASGFFLLLLMLEMGLKRYEALFVAAAWTAHPIGCESVSWIAQRHTAMAMTFGLAGLWSYVRWHTAWKGILLGAGGLALALLCKPSALGFLPLYLAFEMLGGRERLTQSPEEWKRNHSSIPNSAGMAPRIAPLLLLAAVFTYVGIAGARIRFVDPPGGHWSTALLTDTDIFLRYLKNILYPLYLSAFYGVREITSLADPALYLALSMLCVVVGFTLFLARSRRRAAFGWLWFFGALAPNANLIGITYLMQDRYVYIASAGVMLVLVEAVTGVLTRSKKSEDLGNMGYALAGLGSCFVLFLGVCSFQRGRLWRSEQTIFKDAVETEPECGIARIQYGIVLAAHAERLRKTGVRSQGGEAAAHSHEAVKHLSHVEECADSYRYWDPLKVRVLLAREALYAGRLKISRQALVGWLPPRPAIGTPIAFDANRNKEFRALQHGENAYLYKIATLFDGYCWAAHAELLMAQQAKPDSAGKILVHALALVEDAKGLGLARDEPFVLEAKGHLLLDKLSAVSGDAGGSWKHFRLAKAALSSVRSSSACFAEAQWMLSKLEAPHFPDPAQASESPVVPEEPVP